jgi:DnaJ domain/ShK domain-like
MVTIRRKRTVSEPENIIARFRRSVRRRQTVYASVVVCLIVWAWLVAVSVESAAQQDLYQILGVSKTATVKEIKQAYRKKALDTHPDKNRDIPAEEAAEAFRQVVHAFEILSDDSSRKHYDRTGRTSADNGNNRQQHGQRQYRYQWTWTSTTYRPVKLKDKFEVQQAQSRVLHVVSLSQLQTIMLDEDDLLERNVLFCFTTPLSEKHADDEMVFPYPFAGMSSQGIWWEDVLQTIRIRFYRNSELSRFFGVTAEQANDKPVFVFGKRGTPLTAETAPDLPRIHTDQREAFEAWAWQQIEVHVIFVNRHDHPVEIYWIHGSKAHKKLVLDPGESSSHNTMLSHEWYVRDVRIDTHPGSPGRYKLTTESSLGSWKITSDESPQELVIEAHQCFDLSGHCQFWHHHEQACRTNPGFMWVYCQKTCNKCPEPPSENEHDEL